MAAPARHPHSPSARSHHPPSAGPIGGVCTNDIFCTANSGNRDLADSISIAIDRGGGAALVWTDQGSVLHGSTHIEYACIRSQPAYVGANPGLACRGPAGG
jgi:hypothetical protein